MPRSNVISGCVWGVVLGWDLHLSQWPQQSRLPSPLDVVDIIQPIKGLNVTKGGERRNLPLFSLPHCLIGRSHSILSWVQIKMYIISSLGSQATTDHVKGIAGRAVGKVVKVRGLSPTAEGSKVKDIYSLLLVTDLGRSWWCIIR